VTTPAKAMSSLASPDAPLLAGAGSRTAVGLAALAPLAAGMLATMIPVTMLVPMLRELVRTRFGVDPFWAHAFMSVNMLGAILFAPLGGLLADRLHAPRRWIAAALLVDALCLLGMRYAPNFQTLMTLRFIEGAAHVQAVSLWMSVAAGLASGPRAGRTMGVMGAALLLGTALGAPLGGAVGGADPLAVLIVGPVIAAAGVVVALLWVPAAAPQPRMESLAEALRTVRRHRWLLVPYVYTFIDRLCVGVIISTLTLYLAEVLELGPASRGGMMAVFMVPMALLCYPAGRLADHWGRALPMAAGSVLFGVVFASYGLLNAGGMWTAMAFSGVFSALMFAPTLALCRDLAPARLRTTAFAGFNAAGSLGFLAGPLLGGSLVHLLAPDYGLPAAYRAAFLAAGSAQVLCAVLSIPFLRALARRPAGF